MAVLAALVQKVSYKTSLQNFGDSLVVFGDLSRWCKVIEAVILAVVGVVELAIVLAFTMISSCGRSSDCN